MNVRERHETQCHVESGVFIVPLIVMVIYIYINITEIFAFIAVLVFKLLSRKLLFIDRENNRNCLLRIGYF